jgi:hypothetical protein
MLEWRDGRRHEGGCQDRGGFRPPSIGGGPGGRVPSGLSRPQSAGRVTAGSVALGSTRKQDRENTVQQNLPLPDLRTPHATDPTSPARRRVARRSWSGDVLGNAKRCSLLLASGRRPGQAEYHNAAKRRHRELFPKRRPEGRITGRRIFLLLVSGARVSFRRVRSFVGG